MTFFNKTPQLKAQGNQAKLNQNANIFGFICGKNGSMSQTCETGEVKVKVREHKKKRNAGESFRIRAQERRENAQVSFSFNLAGLNVHTDYIKQRLITLRKYKTLQMCWHRKATPVFVGCYTHFSAPYKIKQPTTTATTWHSQLVNPSIIIHYWY